MNRFQEAAARYGDRMFEVAGRPGVYSRGASETEVIYGVASETMREVLTEEGFSTGTFLTGWVFRQPDLTFPTDGDLIPLSGDRWTEELGTWKVLPPGPHQPCYEWVDAGGANFIVWTKKVKE